MTETSAQPTSSGDRLSELRARLLDIASEYESAWKGRDVGEAVADLTTAAALLQRLDEAERRVRGTEKALRDTRLWLSTNGPIPPLLTYIDETLAGVPDTTLETAVGVNARSESASPDLSAARSTIAKQADDLKAVRAESATLVQAGMALRSAISKQAEEIEGRDQHERILMDESVALNRTIAKQQRVIEAAREWREGTKTGDKEQRLNGAAAIARALAALDQAPAGGSE